MTSRDRRYAWYIDNVNQATTPRQALDRTFDWLKAEIVKVEDSRPEAAEGFRWQFVFALAAMAMGMRGKYPAGEFRDLNGRRPLLPGGGWQPKETGAARRP